MSFLLAALGLVVAYLFLPSPRGAGGRSIGSRRAGAALLALVYLLPAAVLGWIFWNAPPEAHRLRLALLGVGFRGVPGEELRIDAGGDRARHPLWVSAFADGGSQEVPVLGVVVFDPDAAAAESRNTTGTAATTEEDADAGDGNDPEVSREAVPPSPLRVQVAQDAPGLLAVPAERRLRPVQAVELRDGDRVTVASVGGGDRTWIVERGWLFGAPFRFVPEAPAGGSPAPPDDQPPTALEIPPRRGDLPILGDLVPIGRPLGGTVATYALAALRGVEPERAAATSSLAQGFIYAEPAGLLGARLFLVPPAGGPAPAIVRDGEPVVVPRAGPLEAGDHLHAVSAPRPRAVAMGNEEDDGPRPLPRLGGMSDRRSFRVFPGERSLAFVYDTPEVITLGPQQVAELRLGREGGSGPRPGEAADTVQRVNLSFGEWQVADRSLHLRYVSDPVAAEAAAVLELGEERTFPATTPRGVTEGRLGAPFWLGGEHRAAIQLDRLAPSFWLVVLALVLALAKATSGRSAFLSPAAAVVAGGLELVLVFRLVLGYRTWASPPHEPEAWTLALLAWFFLPWAFLVASLPAGSERSEGRHLLLSWAPALAGLAASLAWCLALAQGALAGVLAVAHLGVAAVPLLRRFAPRPGRERPRGRPRRRREGWRGRLGSGMAKVGEAGRRTRGRVTASHPYRWLAEHPGTAWSLAALLFTISRAFLLLIGFREAAALPGPRLALSLLHVPGAVLFQAAYLAWLWHRADRTRSVSATDLAPSLAILAFVWLVPAVLVSDLGLALLNVPVFLLALVGVLYGAQRAGCDLLVPRRGWQGRTVAAALLAFLLLYPLGVALPGFTRTLIAVVPEGWVSGLESERNFLRLLGFAYPDQLRDVGRRQSEEMAVMSEVMDRYTSGPFAGRGWFGSELSPHLAPTALREHALSMWVAAEWGVAGSLALLLAYGLMGLAGRHSAPWRDPEGAPPERGSVFSGSGFWGSVAALAGLTLAVPSIYMILANYRLTLFTGKNAYLLGLDSAADLLEGLALVVLVGLGAAVVRDVRGDLEGELS